jgi:hypothetical protein
VRYVDWDALREELFFTESEERAITKRAFELIRDQELARQISEAIAKVDATRWGMQLPSPDHPFWQVYLAYGEAVLKVLQGDEPETIAPQPEAPQQEMLPECTDEELNAIFTGVAADSCVEDDNHMFCEPGCTGPKTTS